MERGVTSLDRVMFDIRHYTNIEMQIYN